MKAFDRIVFCPSFATLLSFCSADLVVYPHATTLIPSDKFSVSLSLGGPTFNRFTNISTPNHRVKDATSVKANRSVSWTSFAFSKQPVTVEIETQRSFVACSIRPRRLSIDCHKITSNQARFTLKQTPLMVSVEFDTDQASVRKDITDKLLIFADTHEESVPLKDDISVMFFDVGIHNLNGQLRLPKEIRHVYLAPGAFVQGGFMTTGDQPVNITGRGILSGATYPFHDPRFVWGLINMDNGSRHRVEGITMVDSPRFFSRGQSSFNTLKNVKMLAPWTYNSDGVGIGMDGLVENSFIWANDDTFKGQDGAVFQMGWWPTRRIGNASLTDIDVIHTDWCTFKGEACRISTNDAVLDLAGNTGEFLTNGLTFSNIYLEDPCPTVMNFQMDSSTEGTVSNFTFLNWTMPVEPPHYRMHNIISGSVNCHINNWKFDNFTSGGNCITNPTSNNFLIDNKTTKQYYSYMSMNKCAIDEMSLVKTVSRSGLEDLFRFSKKMDMYKSSYGSSPHAIV